MSQLKLPQLQDPGNAEKPPVAKLFEQGKSLVVFKTIPCLFSIQIQ